MNQSNLGQACLVSRQLEAGVAESLKGLEVLIEIWREDASNLEGLINTLQ